MWKDFLQSLLTTVQFVLSFKEEIKDIIFAISFNPLGGSSDHSDAEEIESDTELEGAVGGETLPSSHSEELRDSNNSEEKQTSLLDELQDEIDRLRLLSPNGKFHLKYVVLMCVLLLLLAQLFTFLFFLCQMILR